LREPLTPASPWVPGGLPAPFPRIEALAPAAVLRADGVPLPRGPRTVVVAGDGAGPAARTLSERAGWPLLAEPTSGARSGPSAVGTYRLLLDVPEFAGAVQRVVLLGHPTLSRPVSRLLARADVEVVVVAPGGAAWTDVEGAASRVTAAVHLDDDGGPTAGERAWLERWLLADGAARAVLDAHLAEVPPDGLAVARAVAEASGAGGARTLVVGASNPVRDLDLTTEPRPAPARVVANRGLAGIDGTLSTAAGVALASGAPVRALVGDLTFLHDVGGLACGPLEVEPDLQVVVVNDDGGGIFATLEHGAPDRAGTFERVFGTPQGVDLAALCAGFGVPHERVTDLDGLRAALARPVRGRSVVEVPVDRAGLRARRESVRTGVRDAVRATVGWPDPGLRP
ncbi:MAG TPA: thiamine pyrophosphate-dependent enzyme, partial [Actinotalea sp.]|nr:thiamine pyrophosphate-dependent enzyme [Actinotalea sp.]